MPLLTELILDGNHCTTNISLLMELLLEREMARQNACEDFGGMLKQLHSVSGDRMTEEEVQAEIDAVRAEGRTGREGNR